MNYQIIVDGVNNLIKSKNIFSNVEQGEHIERQLKARWWPSNDLQVQQAQQIHGVNFETEIYSLYTDEIEVELSRELLGDIIKKSKTTEWKFDGKTFSEGAKCFKEFLENNCFDTTEWILGSQETMSLIQILPEFQSIVSEDLTIGAYQVGTLPMGKQTIKIFVDSLFPVSMVLIGNSSSCNVRLENVRVKLPNNLIATYKKYFNPSDFVQIKINNFVL